MELLPPTKEFPRAIRETAGCHIITWMQNRAKRRSRSLGRRGCGKPVCMHYETIHASAPIEAAPTLTAGRKNPDRTLSTDRRVIADLRRSNIYYPTDQH